MHDDPTMAVSPSLFAEAETDGRVCTFCHKVRPLAHFFTKTHKPRNHCTRCREMRSRWSKANRDRVAVRQRIYKYGLSPDQFSALAEQQGNVCAICGGQEVSRNQHGGTKPLAVDHDHSTGRVRGLLCSHCNATLGHLEKLGISPIDWARRAALYLGPAEG